MHIVTTFAFRNFLEYEPFFLPKVPEVKVNWTIFLSKKKQKGVKIIQTSKIRWPLNSEIAFREVSTEILKSRARQRPRTLRFEFWNHFFKQATIYEIPDFLNDLIQLVERYNKPEVEISSGKEIELTPLIIGKTILRPWIYSIFSKIDIFRFLKLFDNHSFGKPST